MRKSKSEDLFEPVSKKTKIMIGILFTSPFWILGSIELLGLYYKHNPDPINRPSFNYNYVPKTPDIVYKPPKVTSTRDPIVDKQDKGVTLKFNGVTINTGVDADEIIQQLTIDYQDLFDQYGGSEELY